MTDLVTGEAVPLDIRVARAPSRALALALDLAIEFALLIASIPALVFGLSQIDDDLRGAVFLGVVVLVLIGYPVALETATRGRSVGKMALGLRVVREDGGPIRFRHALTRALSGFFVDFGILGMLGAVALITSLASRRGARVGDLLAGTVVIRERVPAARGVVLGMPPQLAGWAAGLHLAAIPDDLALAARQYLNRADQLSPTASQTMAARLADEMSRHVGQPPPPGTPARAYLAAVLAERRDRDMARATAARATAGHGGPAGGPAPGPTTGSWAGGPGPAGWPSESTDGMSAPGWAAGRAQSAVQPAVQPAEPGGFAPPA